MNRLARCVLIVLLVVLCGNALIAQEATTPEGIEPWACPAGFEGQTLNIFNWSTYIGENTIADFERLCGVTVNYDVFDSDATMLTRLRQGNPGYDIIVPSDFAVPQLIEEELLEPLNLDNIPNFANFDEAYLSTLYDPDNEYALPYLLGTYGIGYNVNSVDSEVTSWQQFFEHNGPVAWADSDRLMLGLGLLMNGYDPNSVNPDEVEIAKQYLLDHSDNVAVIAADDGQELLARGEVDMAIEYDGDIYQISFDCECDDFAYAIPQEGSGLSAGFVAIPVDSLNHPLAEVFIDYILHPVVAADIANYTGYPSPNKAAIDAGLIDEELLEKVYPDAETAAKLFYTLPLGEDERIYLDAWDEVKVRIGQ